MEQFYRKRKLFAKYEETKITRMRALAWLSIIAVCRS